MLKPEEIKEILDSVNSKKWHYSTCRYCGKTVPYKKEIPAKYCDIKCYKNYLNETGTVQNKR